MPTTSVFDAAGPEEVGSLLSGTAQNSESKILWVQVRDGIDGTIGTFVDFRPSALVGAASFETNTGETWSINGNADIVPHISDTTTVDKPNVRLSNIETYDDDGAERPISGLASIGQGEGNDQKSVYVSNTYGEFPLWESKLTLKDESSEPVLESLGQQCLTQRSTIAQVFELELTRNLDPGPYDIKAGDIARVVIDDVYQTFDGNMMVGRKRITLSKEQDEKVTLEVTE